MSKLRPWIILSLFLLIFLACPGEVERKIDKDKEEAGEGNGTPSGSGETLNDLGTVGSAARPMLRKGSFTEVVIEIAFVPGRDPGDGAVSHLEAVLAEITGKPVSVKQGEIPRGDGSYAALIADRCCFSGPGDLGLLEPEAIDRQESEAGCKEHQHTDREQDR